MSDTDNKIEDINVNESQDGSATVDVPENLIEFDEGGDVSAAENNTGDNNDLQEAKRNRRRAKKDLIRKTNQEKDARLIQLQRENEIISRRLAQLERNTKAEHITRIDKNIEDAQVRLEYAKMKLAEATQNQDGEAMVEAQTLWQSAQEEVRNLASIRKQADREMREQPQQEVHLPDQRVQKLAAKWMKKNKWYNPAANDVDSKVAKQIDQLMVTQGWNPSDPDYWDELTARLQKELPHRYNDSNDVDEREVKRPRNVVGSSGREASAAYGGSNRTQFVLSPERVRAMKEAGAWDNPERKARMIKEFMAFDRSNGRNN